MARNLLLLSIILLLPQGASAQELFMPIEYREAYKRGSRLPDGSVSDKYFQNRAIYDIEAEVDPATRQVSGKADIRYFNEGPRSLKEIVFHSYKDLYKDGMILKSLEVDGEKIDLENGARTFRYGTCHYILMPGRAPLAPGGFVDIHIEWGITIPATVDRDGAFDSTSMFVGYWYPEIAVYDDVFGWDNIIFDGKSEFYHDFSDYKVSIKIPKKYVVWASAAPINADEIYPKKIKSKLDKLGTAKGKIQIISQDDLKGGLKMKSGVWQYDVKGFPDFSFAFSDHYLWEAKKYTDKYGEYTLNTAFPAKNDVFEMVADIEEEALELFHSTFPKYPFPFKHFVAFNGETGGGMEFAGMCNNAARENYSTEGRGLTDYDANKLLTVHEMMHMYYPFLMGINEKRHGWLDEGMVEYAEDAFTGVDLETVNSRRWLGGSGNPPAMTETYTIPKSYVVVSYDISSQAFYALRSLLGTEVFDKCMIGFMKRWEYKHPVPYDLFYTFNDLSGQDLNWFWEAWFFDWGYPDVGIGDFKKGTLSLENIGAKPIAISVEITDEENKTTVRELSPEIWKDKKVYSMKVKHPKTVKFIAVKTLNGDDAVRENNYWAKPH